MVMVASLLLLLSACAGGNTPASAPASSSTGTNIAPISSNALLEFTDLVFNDQSVVYDGAKHSLTVQNVPAGATVAYSGQDYINAGTYLIDAMASKEGYASKTLRATLTITEAELTAENVASMGLSLKDASYPFDGESHALQLTGDVPSGTSVSYTIDGAEGNTAVDVGEHVVIATLKMPNYHAYALTAKLSIVAVEKTLCSTVVGTAILFQNDLDSDSLYSYDGSLKKVSHDVMDGFSGTGSLSFGIVKSLWGKAVVSFQKDANGSLQKTKALVGVSVDVLAAVDATHFYYSVHNLLVNKEDNGLYYYDTSKSDDDYRGEKIISDDYATAMVYSDGVLYYINSEKNIVSYASGTKTTYLADGNIYELTAKDGYLYYNKGSVAAKGLYRMAIASKQESKLTLDNGRDLSIIGNALYYINKDVLTTGLFGKGVYRVPLDGTLFNQSGSLVISGESDKIGSLTSDGTSLYYYRFNNCHFYQNAASGAAEVDLMADFVKPEDTTLVGGTANAYGNGQVYFANLKDDDCLYKYDLTSRQAFKVLPYSVNNVYVNGNYLYFGSFVLTNYAEWRMDLTSKNISKISKDRCESLRFVGEKIYYLNVGTAGATLHEMGLDGTGDRELSSKGMDPFSLEVIDGKAYSVRDPAIGYKKLAVTDIATATMTETSQKCLSFIKGAGSELYLYDGADKTLVHYQTGSETSSTLLSAIPELSDLAFANGTLYAQNVGAKQLFAYQNGAFAALADIAPSGVVGDGTSLFFVSAKTSFVDNYPVTAYDKATSNGALYSFSHTLTCLAQY